MRAADNNKGIIAYTRPLHIRGKKKSLTRKDRDVFYCSRTDKSKLFFFQCSKGPPYPRHISTWL